MTKIVINGFGRIGRSFFRAAWGLSEFDIVAVNDLADEKTLMYLLKYDSVYGRYLKEPKGVQFLAERDPAKLPWKKLGVDIVIESTGFFTTADKAKAHLDAGAKRVVITAPAKGDVITALIGVNDDIFAKNKNPLTCNASCTTNSVSPAMKIILENFGVKKAAMTTVHGYTATQKLVDGPVEKDPRRGRAAAANIVPSTTGAAEAVIQSIPELEGKFQAESIRVPTITGSISITSAFVEKSTTCEEVNEVFNWYDNEAGYTATLVEHVRRVADMLI